ncbi:hypothetical protein KFU94_35820 [Chloroflexi bacterium TSY]|nr:hypothetical protein [Chloroflexi bacterium TSY]
MSRFQSRMLAHNDIPDLLAFVSNNANARWPQPSYLLSSDVAWRISGDAPTSIRLWFDQRGLAAYAWYGFNGPSEFDLRADREYDTLLTQDVIRWLEQRRRQDPSMFPWLIDLTSMEEWEQAIASHASGRKGVEKIAQVGVFDCASHRIDLLLDAEYQPTQHFGYYLSRSLKEPIPEPVLPDGWRIRHVLESDFEARVAVHRDASFGSSFDMKRY